MFLNEKNGFNDVLHDTLANLHIHHRDSYLRTIKAVRNNRYPYEDIHGTEKILLVLLIFIKLLMPSFWIRHFTEQKDENARILDSYHLWIPVLFLVILMYNLDQHSLIMIWVVYLLFDLFISILSSLLLSDIFVKKLSIRKQFLALSYHLWEIIFWFAILYQHYEAIGYLSYPDKQVHSLWAIYYSLSTLTTVWYGDIGSINNYGMIITMLQMLYWLIFMGIVLSAYFSKVKIKAE